MLKTRKRWVSLLVAVVMVAALVVPFVGTASAATTYSLSYIPAVSAGATTNFTNLYLTVTMDNTSAMNIGGSTMVIQLPSSPTGYTMGVNSTVYDPSGVFAASALPALTVSGGGTDDVTITVPSYSPAAYTGAASTSSFAIGITSLYVPGGVNGNVALTTSAPNNSMFASGSVTLATAGSGSVTLAAESVQSIPSGSAQTLGTIDITESMMGALKDSGGDALKLTLPPGITWNTVIPSVQWGTWPAVNSISTTSWPFAAVAKDNSLGVNTPSAIVLSSSNGGRELDVSCPSATASTSGAYIKLSGTVNIDESTAKQGDIVVSVAGAATYSPSTLTVGSYGTFAINDKATSAPTITAGIEGSTIGTFQVSEGLTGSLLGNRTIDLTLPTDVAWTEVPQIDTANSTLDNISSVTWEAVGSTGNEIEGTVNMQSGASTTTGSTPAVIAFKNAEVTPAVDFTGPITATLGGTEGLTGTLNLGTVAAGITATAATTPDVAIGTASAAIGDFTITETAADNIQSLAENSGLDENNGDGVTTPKNWSNSAGASTPAGAADDQYFVATNTASGTAEIDVWAPNGVTFFNTPTVTVTSGDLQIGNVSTSTIGNQGELVIDVKSTSTTPATIDISGAQITVDRTVPEGPITFKVKGTAVDETQLGTQDPLYVIALFPNDDTAASANVATVTTAAPNSTTGTAVFTIGQTSYTLNGTSVNMDVAPFIQDSRTFLPLRYVANALGVSDSNIMWDPNSQKVTIIKGSLVGQFTIGSTTMLINGAAVTMDTAPEITDGRTCLPVAWVAEALGAQIAWDATAQTATITF